MKKKDSTRFVSTRFASKDIYRLSCFLIILSVFISGCGGKNRREVTSNMHLTLKKTVSDIQPTAEEIVSNSR